VAQQASWTQSASLKLGPHGLSREAPHNSMLPYQLQTNEPIALGFYWLPARSASIWATLSPTASPITLQNGQTFTPDPGRLFARYSPDTKHWSAWQVLALPSTELTHCPWRYPQCYVFSGELNVPQQEYGQFEGLPSTCRLSATYSSATKLTSTADNALSTSISSSAMV